MHGCLAPRTLISFVSPRAGPLRSWRCPSPAHAHGVEESEKLPPVRSRPGPDPVCWFCAAVLSAFPTAADRKSSKCLGCRHRIGKDCARLGAGCSWYIEMEFTDKILKCSDCGSDFVFTAGEQLFFHDKQFKNDPKRCKLCKTKRAAGSSAVRSETRTNCSACGTETTVPFKPTQGRPVLCRQCFQQRRAPAIAVSA